MIINDDTKLRKYVPNVLATAKGEASLFDKVMPFLEESELWVFENFLRPQLIDTANSNEISVIERIIVNDAMYHAIPSLDIVLTPNGFGIVSNQNIAPASKERVERLVAQYEKNRDLNILLLLQFLPKHEGWIESEQGQFFSSTLFPNLTVVKNLGISEHLWENYLTLRDKIMIEEAELTEEYFGHVLMDCLRKQTITNSFATRLHRYISEHIRTYIIYKVKGEKCNRQFLADLITIIRNNPDDFTEWFESSISELFTPEVFINKKKSSGYFF